MADEETGMQRQQQRVACHNKACPCHLAPAGPHGDGDVAVSMRRNRWRQPGSVVARIPARAMEERTKRSMAVSSAGKIDAANLDRRVAPVSEAGHTNCLARVENSRPHKTHPYDKSQFARVREKSLGRSGVSLP